MCKSRFSNDMAHITPFCHILTTKVQISLFHLSFVTAIHNISWTPDKAIRYFAGVWNFFLTLWCGALHFGCNGCHITWSLNEWYKNVTKWLQNSKWWKWMRHILGKNWRYWVLAPKGVQEKESIMCVRYWGTNLSLGSQLSITQYCLVAPNGDS